MFNNISIIKNLNKEKKVEFFYLKIYHIKVNLRRFLNNPGWSNGRTEDFDSSSPGSNPGPGANLKKLIPFPDLQKA